MKRPKSHQVGDLAENFVEQRFLSEGWIVRRCLPDYGFDFLVEPSSGETHYSNLAFVQVKGTDSTLHPGKDGTLPFVVFAKHLELWFHADVPSYLCVVELELRRAFLSNTGYFLHRLRAEYEQDAPVAEPFFKWLTKQDTRTILIEHDNMILDGDRLTRMSRALEKAWNKLRSTRLSSRTPDMAWSPVIGVKCELRKAFSEETAESLFASSGAQVYGDF